MSGNVRQKRRPTPAVYRRRRLVVLLVLVVVVLGVVRLFTGGGDDPAPAAQPVAPTSSATPAAPTAAPSSAPATAEPRTRKEVDVDVDLSAASGACDARSVAVRPGVPGGAFAAGPVPVRLAFTTTASRPCSLDLADVDLIVDVANEDGNSLWSTQVCPDAVPQRSVQLDPTWSTTVDLTWSGRRGGDECAADERFVPAKTYQVRAAVLGGEPGTADVVLRTRPAPTPAPTPTPTPAPTPEPSSPAPSPTG